MKYLLIDGQNLLYRAHFTKKLTDKKGNTVSGIFGVMRMTMNLLKKFSPDVCIVCWDLGRSKERLKLYPEYKANRDARDPQIKKDISRQAKICQSIFSNLPIRQVVVEGVEADDTIGILCEKLKGQKIVVSNDLDFVQLIGKKVSLYNPKREKLMTVGNVEKIIGFPVKHYVLWKCMVGDSCLCGETRIKLLSGGSIKIQDMNDSSGYWVYSFDVDNMKIVPAKATMSKLTRHVKTLYRVWFDNNKFVDCTSNHPFLMSDGKGYVCAENLSVGDSILPIYTRKAKRSYAYGSYEEVNQKFAVGRKWQLTHKMVAEHFTECSKRKRTIHHIDGNMSNNEPDNLVYVSDSEHMKIHNSVNDYSNVRKKWDDKVYKEKMRKCASTIGKRTGKANITKYNRSKKKLEEQSKRLKGLAEAGKHPFQRDDVRLASSKRYREIGLRLAREGKNVFQRDGFHKKLNSDPNIKIGQARGKIHKVYKLMLEHGLDPTDWKTSRDFLIGIGVVRKNCVKNPLRYFDTFDDIKLHNHTVTKIELLQNEKLIPVYDICVDKFNNFALESGVFVHNSDNIKGIKGVGEKTATKIILERLNGGPKRSITPEEQSILDRNKHLITIGALTTKKQMSLIKKMFISEKNKKPNVNSVRAQFAKLGFKSLYYNFDEWKRPLRKLKC